jgi:hypothetical protein
MPVRIFVSSTRSFCDDVDWYIGRAVLIVMFVVVRLAVGLVLAPRSSDNGSNENPVENAGAENPYSCERLLTMFVVLLIVFLGIHVSFDRILLLFCGSQRKSNWRAKAHATTPTFDSNRKYRRQHQHHQNPPQPQCSMYVSVVCGLVSSPSSLFCCK